MVGWRWEACPSWVPVSLDGFSSLLDGYTQSLCIISVHRILKDRHSRAKLGRAPECRIVQSSAMRGVLLVPSSPTTLSPALTLT